MSLPRIAITMGDPAGVGPELALRLLDQADIRARCTPVVFGDAQILARVAQSCGLTAPKEIIDSETWQTEHSDIHQPTVLDLPTIDADDMQPGKTSADTGRASYQYIEAAIAAALAGQVAAITTGPIQKEALHDAGIDYPGHTEIFSEKTRASRTCMMLTSEEITCSLVTAHVGHQEVSGLLSAQRVLEVIQLSAQAMSQLCGRAPKLVVCGLNPHAGEHGLFGEDEEEKFIRPAVATARADGIDVEGPLPADTAFLPDRRHDTDCYVCMYHDQGLIPLKTLAFDTAVNWTLGLPIIRTSVDHGTALDIAWQGRASSTSLIAATNLAARLAAMPRPSA